MSLYWEAKCLLGNMDWILEINNHGFTILINFCSRFTKITYLPVKELDLEHEWIKYLIGNYTKPAWSNITESKYEKANSKQEIDILWLKNLPLNPEYSMFIDISLKHFWQTMDLIYTAHNF